MRKLTSGLKKEFAILVKGKVSFNEPLAKHTTFKIGGPADIWARPKDLNDLVRITKFSKEKKIPFLCLGSGSNLLVRDKGIRGIVISLSAPYFRRLRFTPSTSGYKMVTISVWWLFGC